MDLRHLCGNPPLHVGTLPYVRYSYFMNAKHLYALTILHASISPLWYFDTSWSRHTLMPVIYFMRHGYFLCLTLTSCMTITLMGSDYFMNWTYIYEWHSLHASLLPLRVNPTSWKQNTFMLFKYFMWTWKYCTLMRYVHFMTKVNFYGLPLLHGSKTPLCT
jgi:hypothetical protein